MIIFSLCFLLFLNSMSIGLVFPIFAPLFTESNVLFSPTTSINTQTFAYSMILAVPTFCMIFGAPFWGRISDKIGRKKVLLIGLSGLAFSFVLSALGIYVSSLLLLFLSRALAGFMDGSEAIAQAAIVDLSTSENKARHMGFATFAGTIGFIIGPVVGGFLAEPSLTGRFHYEIPFILSLFLTGLNIFALYYFLPAVMQEKKEDNASSYLQILSKGFSICFDKRIRWFSFLLFVLQFSLAAYFQLSTLVLANQFKYSSSQIGLFTTFLGACFSAGIFFVIHVMLERIKYVTLLRSGMGLIAFSILTAIYFHQSTNIAWVSVVPMMLGIAMMYNVLLVLLSNSVSENEQGEVMGSGTSLKALGWLISGIFVGSLYPQVFVLLTGMLLIVIIAFMSIRFILSHKQLKSITQEKQALAAAEDYSKHHPTYLE
jgi:MFS family permease